MFWGRRRLSYKRQTIVVILYSFLTSGDDVLRLQSRITHQCNKERGVDAMNTLLTRSWRQVCEDLPGFTNLFYDRLFTTHSSLRELF